MAVAAGRVTDFRRSMTKKTESLSFPRNALDSMRELGALDTGKIETPPGPHQERDHVTTLPETHVASNEAGSVTTNAVTSRGGSEVTKLRTAKQNPREPAP